MFYPKIDTLFDRDKATRKVDFGAYRLPEFRLIDKWLVTEKIDGTNVRIELEGGRVQYHGRTDNAQMPTTLVNWLHEFLPPLKVVEAFDYNAKVTLFGEGYGAGIQKGGNYRSDPSFRLFDVVVDDGDWRWWLNWENVVDVAEKLFINTVPVVSFACPTFEAIEMAKGISNVAIIEHKDGINTEFQREGIVCRTEPLMLQRNGNRIVWKLKAKDFPIT